MVGKTPDAMRGPPAVSACPKTMTKRADFLRASKAKRTAVKGFILQARKRTEGEANAGSVRVGFTCSKKVGNAVKRNRAKRRLRAIVRDVLPAAGHSGWDYVLIGRAGATINRPYRELVGDLTHALSIIHGATK